MRRRILYGPLGRHHDDIAGICPLRGVAPLQKHGRSGTIVAEALARALDRHRECRCLP